jgi:hypothetical protein
MNASYKNKLLASAVTAVLLISSLVFLTGAQASPAEDLEITEVSELLGNPPPRVNVPYDISVSWSNEGSASYDATVRLYDDCDLTTKVSESDTITMGAGETGSVILEYTFSEEGELCFSATIFYNSGDYGEFEAYINVEPETGEADLWIALDMDGTNFAAGEDISVIFEYGNDGDVSTLNPVTLMAYFDPIDEDPANYFAPSPFMFDYISPPPADAPPEAERMEWQYTVPSDTSDGRYKFTVIIDSDENNTEEDPDSENNFNELEVCIGDCSEPDLTIWEGGGIDSLRAQPDEPVAGTTVSFFYSVENIGEGDAKPPNPFEGEEGDFVMHLEVMKCPDEDCTGQSWVKVNETEKIRTDIGAGQTLHDDSVLGMNWTTAPQDAGIWNIRIMADGQNVVEETNEDNNYLDWFKSHDGYFVLREQRPDLVVVAIDEGIDKVYQGDPRTIQVAVGQTSLGDAMADGVEVHIKIKDPDLTIIDWFQIDESYTVGLAPETTFFEYTFTPTKLGVYEFYAYVDREDTILEWDDTNNEYDSDKYIEVFEKLPDLQVVSMSMSPVNEDGYAMVGVSSEVTATIANLGVRDMTSSEGTKLEVTFYTSAPFASQLATINVDQALAIGDTVDITIPFTFTGNDQYRIIAKVDEAKLIAEEEENNNEAYKNIYAVSSIDAYVDEMSVFVGDGLAGKDHSITFDLGMANLPDEGTYRLFFNVSVDGTFGWGDVLAMATQNMTGYHPVGTGYHVSQDYGLGYVDFNSSYSNQTVVMPWIPNKDRTDTYNVSVEVSSVINVDETNDVAYAIIDIEKLTTNLVVDAIKVTESDGSATIKVTVGYPQGEQAQLDAEVSLMVYKASDYEAGNPPIDQLTTKTITGILRGDSRPVSFTWAVKNGDFIFVAVLDPDDKVKEVDENDNTYPSLQITFGDSGPDVVDEEEDAGLLPAPSLFSALAMIGVVALLRRRS